MEFVSVRTANSGGRSQPHCLRDKGKHFSGSQEMENFWECAFSTLQKEIYIEVVNFAFPLAPVSKPAKLCDIAHGSST